MTLRTLGISFFALSAFAMSAVAHAQPVVPKAQEVERQETREMTTAVRPNKQSEKQIARAQNQLNRHFSDAVVKPTLRECWSRVQGDGAIVFDFTYRRSGSRWVFDRIALIKSNLSAGQDEVALRCMQDSVGSTSFSVKLADLPGAYGPNFVVRWTWPVPLPPQGTVVAHINDGGLTGSRDCQTCQHSKCEAAKSGFTGCRTDPKQPNVCSTDKTACMSGAFGGGYIARGF